MQYITQMLNCTFKANMYRVRLSGLGLLLVLEKILHQTLMHTAHNHLPAPKSDYSIRITHCNYYTQTAFIEN